MTATDHETEIKLRIADLAAAKRLLTRDGFRIAARRTLESDLVVDSPEGFLRSGGALLRVRRRGREGVLTYKGPAEPGPHKSREELETKIEDPGRLEKILARLGLQPAFRYEKYRTVYSRRGARGKAMLDETPIGVFLELEGDPAWIDRTARRLGFSPADFITASYSQLYREYQSRHPDRPGDMLFVP